jgi:hypothetical protein
MAALAVALCALAAMATPAFAREKLVFGEFEATRVNQPITEGTPGELRVNKEGGIDIEGLQLGPYTFGPKPTAGGKQDEKHPCGHYKLEGKVASEKSSTLTFHIKFNKCPSWDTAGGGAEEMGSTSFTLGFTLKSNYSAEVGKSTNELTIEEGAVTFKGAQKKCPVLIEKQTIPFKENPEREYEEIVEYENESEEPEGFEHSKKLKELYPSGEKEFLNVVLAEKFKHIRSYLTQNSHCTNSKGTENPKIVTDPNSPYKGDLEYTDGHVFGEIELIEVKNGNLKFNEP